MRHLSGLRGKKPVIYHCDKPFQVPVAWNVEPGMININTGRRKSPQLVGIFYKLVIEGERLFSGIVTVNDGQNFRDFIAIIIQIC